MTKLEFCKRIEFRECLRAMAALGRHDLVGAVQVLRGNAAATETVARRIARVDGEDAWSRFDRERGQAR